jgi:hypothetical protein
MITTGLTTQAKLAMLTMLAQQPMKIALYDGSANIGPETDAYTTQGEAVGRGYKAGGLPLRNPRVFDDRGSACLGWDSPTIPVATLSANGFMIYSPALGNKAIFVGSYDGTYTSSEGPFRINLAADSIVIS